MRTSKETKRSTETIAIGQDRVPDSCLPYRGRRPLSAEHQWHLSGVVRHCPNSLGS